LYCGRVLRHGGVEGQRAIHQASGDLSSVDHLAQCRRPGLRMNGAELISVNAVTPFFQFANTYYSNSVLVTNWSQYFPGQGQIANGTTVVTFLTNMLPWVVDNFQLGRLAVVSNAHSASTLLDPTNTFVFITP
jgi:hypothetical protein